MSQVKKVLIVVTSHEQLGNTDKKTGYWLGEVSHFCDVIVAAGFEVDFVSPQGGKPPMDAKSSNKSDQINQKFLQNDKLLSQLEQSFSPDQVNPEAYDAIYYAGGHGTMWDFADNVPLAQIAAAMYENDKIVAAVCHGPTGLLNIKLSNGQYLLAGKQVTGFSNLEESLVRLTSAMPFLLEDELKHRGATYKKTLPFIPHVEVSERLVTGQNPQSTKALAKAVVKLLQA
ncbi:MAG: type 1 glutamine amidotransferase domain-containing protein [Cyanothece sp. SIO1E1]|nr:type 1 glutamine amidotransferase domain-containing protein [Cyanothece sp. SIO1E1]